MRPSFALNVPPFQKLEGAGNAGRSLRPQPRVRNKIKHTSVVTTVTPDSPGIPRAMVLTVSFVLSPVTGLFCHRHRAVARQLDASVGASGPHDFAVRVSVARPARRRVHRIPPPTSVTIAKRPSEEAGPNRYIADFTPPSSENSENQKSRLPPIVWGALCRRIWRAGRWDCELSSFRGASKAQTGG
jgi:hypothetical protein